MTTTLFEDFVNAELPLRIGTVEVTPPTAGKLPVYKGVGLLTEAKTLAEAGIAEVDDLADVATSGSYNDLSDKPTIPAAQVNADWGAGSGVAQILNKPTLGTAAAQNVGYFATAAQGTKADSALQAVSPAITAGTYGSDVSTVSITANAAGQVTAIAQYVKSDAVVDATNGGNTRFGLLSQVTPSRGGNTAFGTQVQQAITTGLRNTAVGTLSQPVITTGAYNVAMGYKAQSMAIDLSSCVAIGNEAQAAMVSGVACVAVGQGAQEAGTGGNSNTGVGNAAQYAMGAGYCNSAVGAAAQISCTTGRKNTSVGTASLTNISTGYNNTAVGNCSGANITTGSGNTIIGTYRGTTALVNNVVLATTSGDTSVSASGDPSVGVVVAQHNATDWEMKGALFQNVVVGATKTLTANSQLVVEVTSNTLLTFKLKGTDGTTRTATLTLT